LALQSQFGPWPTSMKLSVSLRSVALLGRVISSSQGLYLYTNTEKRTHTNTKPTIPASERVKKVHALDRSATVTGCLPDQTDFFLINRYISYRSSNFCLPMTQNEILEVLLSMKQPYSMQHNFLLLHLHSESHQVEAEGQKGCQFSSAMLHWSICRDPYTFLPRIEPVRCKRPLSGPSLSLSRMGKGKLCNLKTSIWFKLFKLALNNKFT
jgi:hypothetical protein